ncbi:hypothetical protein [Streptomyces phaeoluteigriseus]
MLDDVRLPVRELGVVTAELLQLVLDKEGDDIGERDRVLLGVGESRDLLAADQWRAVFVDGVAQDAGAWQTRAKGLPERTVVSMSRMESVSTARSHRGPWPPR